MGNKHNCSMVREKHTHTHTPVDGAKASADDVGLGVCVDFVVGRVSAISVGIGSIVAISKLSVVVYLVWMWL